MKDWEMSKEQEGSEERGGRRQGMRRKGEDYTTSDIGKPH